MAEGVEDDRISGEGDESGGKRRAAPIGRERIAGLGDDPGAQEAGGVGEGRGRRLRGGRESAGIDLQSSGGSLSEQQPERGAAEAEVEAGPDTGGGADLHHDARAPHAEEATGNPSGGGGGGGGGMRVEDVAGVGLVAMPVLPERARQLIMSFLPLRMAIRMSTVSKPWLRTWMENRQYLKYLFTSSKQIEPIRQELDRRGIRRLHSFSVSVRCSQLNQEDFNSLLRYAAQCFVQNLGVDLFLKRKAYYVQLPEMRPGLVRLSLRRVGITRLQQVQAFSIPTLEHLEIMGTALDDQTLHRLILGCPHLRFVDLQRCTLMRRIDFNGARNDLRSIIVAECPLLRIINAPTANCLISFTYSGDFSELAFSPSAELSNLYICFGGPPFARTLKPSHKWISLMCNLSLLKVLTICSVALENIYSWTENIKNISLSCLQELQLLMFTIKSKDISNICRFLRLSHCSVVERLFVQMPVDEKEDFQDALPGIREDQEEENFKKLAFVKIMNFKFHLLHMELVELLCRKSPSLKKLLLITGGGFPTQTECWAVKTDAVIMVVDSDDRAVMPFHSQIFTHN